MVLFSHYLSKPGIDLLLYSLFLRLFRLHIFIVNAKLYAIFQSQCSRMFYLCTAWKKKHSSGDSISTSFILRLFFWLFTVSQVENMNIHELPWHINQVNYAAWFTEPNPHVQANNFQCHPAEVFCHHHGWRLCHNLTRLWHWPMGHGWRNACLLTSVWEQSMDH